MNPIKHIEELSPSTRDSYAKKKVRGRWQYSKLWEDTVNRLTEPGVKYEAIITHFVSQPILNNAPAPWRGYLVHNLTCEILDARKLASMTRQDWGLIGRGIRELIRVGVFAKDEEGRIYDVVMRSIENPQESSEILKNPQEPKFSGGELSREKDPNESSAVEDSRKAFLVGEATTEKAAIATAAGATVTGQKEGPRAGPGPFSSPTAAEVAEVLAGRQLARDVTPEWIAGRIVKYGVNLAVLRKLFDKGLIKGVVTQQAIN